MATPENFTSTEQLAKVLDVDFVNRFNGGVTKLVELLSVHNIETLAAGTQIEVYKTSGVLQDGSNIAEGEVIPLSQYKHELVDTHKLAFKKYRKATSAEAVITRGYEQAVTKTDNAMLADIQKALRNDIFAGISSGTGAIAAGETPQNMQQALAFAWAALETAYENESATPVYFLNPVDVAKHIGNAQVTMQTSFGLTYIENFIGLGTAIVDAKVPAGTIFATAKENLNVYAADISGAQGFDFYMDESGLVGIHHDARYENVSLETVAMTGLFVFPELIDGIIKVENIWGATPAG